MYTLSTFLVGHELRLSETQILASGSVAFDTVHFDFDENWAGLSKVALFWSADGNAYGSMVDAEGNAAVPWEALADAGRIKFGVYGVTGSGDDAVRATSTLIHYKLPEGAWTEDGQQPTPAEQTIIEQAIAAIQSAVENLDREPIIRDGIWYTWDIHADDYVSTGVSAIGPQGPQGPQGPMGDVTPAAQQAVSDAQAAAAAAAGSATAAAGSAADADDAADRAEAAMATKVDVSDIANDLTTTTAGKVLDARQGKALADDVGALSAAMTYVVSGNKSIETATIPVGAYVRLVSSTIAGRSDGIYTVATAIPVDTVVDGTYFNESAPISGGIAGAIQQSMAHDYQELVSYRSCPTTETTYTYTFDTEKYTYFAIMIGWANSVTWSAIKIIPLLWVGSIDHFFVRVNESGSNNIEVTELTNKRIKVFSTNSNVWIAVYACR